MRSARTRPMRASASSSARCFAATCSAGCACCSVQPPHTPKCGQRGTTRDAFAFTTDVTRAVSKRRLGADRRGVDAFAGQRAFDEDRLAVDVRHAATFLVERLDRQQRGGGEDGGGHAKRHGVAPKRTKGRELYLCGVATTVGSGKIRRMRLLAFDTSTQWLSVACGAQAYVVRPRGAGGAGAFRAPAAAHRRRARGGGLVAALARRHRLRRRSRIVYRRAHCLRRRAGLRRWARTFRSCRCPRFWRWRMRRGANTRRRTSWRASTRGCARSTSQPTSARNRAGATCRHLRSSRPTP